MRASAIRIRESGSPRLLIDVNPRPLRVERVLKAVERLPTCGIKLLSPASSLLFLVMDEDGADDNIRFQDNQRVCFERLPVQRPCVSETHVTIH